MPLRSASLALFFPFSLFPHVHVHGPIPRALACTVRSSGSQRTRCPHGVSPLQP